MVAARTSFALRGGLGFREEGELGIKYIYMNYKLILWENDFY